MTTTAIPALTVPHTIDYEVMDCADCAHPFHLYECSQTVTRPYYGGDGEGPCACDVAGHEYGAWFALTCSDCGKRVEREGIADAEAWAAGHECAA